MVLRCILFRVFKFEKPKLCSVAEHSTTSNPTELLIFVNTFSGAEEYWYCGMYWSTSCGVSKHFLNINPTVIIRI